MADENTKRWSTWGIAVLTAGVLALATLGVVPASASQAPPSATGVLVPRGSSAVWVAHTGITFNQPTGTREQRTRIVQRIHDAIDHTPAGETIRIATYYLGLTASADRLIAAKRRGVRVQVIVNANLIGPTEARVQRAIGKNPAATSFLITCKDACRNASPHGNMHLKVYSFTRTGQTRKLLISSSSNLGGPAMHGQWNDSIAVAGEEQLFATWWRLFEQLRRDRAVSPRRVTYTSDRLTAYFQRPSARTSSRVSSSSATSDAPYVRLSKVSCTAPAGFGNSARRTVITVNMRAWYGARGERLAGLLARRKRYGCQVRVIGSLMSEEVVRILVGARIPVKAADWDWGPRSSTSDPDRTVYGPSCYAHLKYVTVNGAYDGRGDRLVWAGSENWSPPGLSSDEVTFEVHDPKVVKAYDDQFKRMWDSPRATHRVGIQPRSRPCAGR